MKNMNERWSFGTCMILLVILLCTCTGCTTTTTIGWSMTKQDVIEREFLNERLPYPMADTVPIITWEF